MDTTYPTTRTIPTVPSGNFLLGNMGQFLGDTLNFITGVARDYGAVARYRLGNMTLTAVNHPDGLQRVLHDNNRNYLRGDYFNKIRAIIGEGLLASEGEHWLRQRRMMQPHFHRHQIAGFAEIMTRRTTTMLDRWEKDSLQNKPFNFTQEMADLTMGVITECMFSTHFTDSDHKVGNAISYLLEDLNYRYIVPFYPGYAFPTLRNYRARRALRTVDDVILGIIDERRRQGGGGDDMLGMLMSSIDEETGEGMSDRHVRDEAITIFGAGHETTAVTLAWLFYLLSQHPQAANRLYAEVDALGDKTPDMSDLAKLTYTRQCIDETMRVYPPAWMTNREALQDDEVSGFHISAGSIVMISPYVTHHLPEFWPNPEQFDPDRFTPEKNASRPSFAYLPFGGGPHKCIGNNFALVEATLVAAVIAQRYRLELEAGAVVTPQISVTLRPKGGLPLIPRQR